MIGGRTGISKDVPPYMMMKHYGMVVGLNVVGLRRAGVNSETRMALKRAYKEIFRSGRPVSQSVAMLREQWAGQEMPKEVAHLLEFCGEKSKRGLSRGPRAIGTLESLEDDD
jgi:UDP-N-acetylglucosamine acyltransferase